MSTTHLDQIAGLYEFDVNQIVKSRMDGDDLIVLVDFGIGGIKKYAMNTSGLSVGPINDGALETEPIEIAMPNDDLANMLKRELQELAADYGLTGYAGMTKAELIDALEAVIK